MEIRQKVRGIAHETDVAKVTLLRRARTNPAWRRRSSAPSATPTSTSTSSLQNVGHDGTTDVSFTIAEFEPA